MTQLSLSRLNQVATNYTNMKKRVENIKKEAEEKVMIAVQTAEIATAAFGFGVINGRWARPEFVGVPVDALAALAGHAAGFLLDTETSKHLHNLADGALSSYMAGLGAGIGSKMRLESLNPSGAAMAAA
jgi:hypothetical protein